MFRLAFMASFFLIVACLLAVGLMSWSRTRALRHGTVRRVRDPPDGASFPSSRATLLAALAGVSVIAWGASASGAQPMEAVSLIPIGIFITVAGSVARVTGLCTDDDGLVVLFARRPPFRACWSELRALRPPGSPLGGWRLTGVRGGHSTLMPSDLFGHEEQLEAIVIRAALRFDGRIWSRDPAGDDG